MKPERKVEYWGNGQIFRECWSLNNQYHREDGPADTIYYENGQIEYESWYINNEELTETEIKIKKELKEFDRLLEEAISEA